MNPKYLKLTLDKPEIVALKYPKPNEVAGLSGPELRWILLDGRALYTPLYVGELISKLGVKAGQRFQIEKRAIQDSKGPGKRVHWFVSKLTPLVEQAVPIQAAESGSPKPDSPLGSGARQPGQSSDPDGVESAQPGDRPAGTRSIPVPPSASGNPAGSRAVALTGDTVTQPAGVNNSPLWPGSRRPQDAVKLLSSGSDPYDPHGVEAKPQVQTIRRPPTSTSSRLAAALKTAVSAAAEAEKHAESLGYACRFSSADVRALGITAFIQGGNGGRNAA